MNTLQGARLGPSIASALGFAPDPGAGPERLYQMKILPGRSFLRGSTVHAEGQVVEVNEADARRLFAGKVAVAVNPTDFRPLLSMPVVVDPVLPDMGPNVPWFEVKMKKDAFWHNRTHVRGDTVKVPEPTVCLWLHNGVAELAKGDGLSERGKSYLTRVNKGVYGIEY